MNIDPARAGQLASSLTAETAELLPCLPYLLQDLWALGAPPECVEKLVTNGGEFLPAAGPN